MFHLQVLTPENIVFDEMVISFAAPGGIGYLGVLTNHAPLISLLKTGTLTITDKNKTKQYFEIKGGFLEVNQNEAVLLVDEIEKTDPANISRQKSAI